MEEFDENIFDEEKIEASLKKGKKKSVFMIIFVSIFVFILLNLVNFLGYSYFSNQAYNKWDAYIKLSSPNTYISETSDSKGFMGGETRYKISKDMRVKSLVIEEDQYQFGLFPSLTTSRGYGGKIGHSGDDWQLSYKDNGWRELLFFHPEVEYEKYKNDLERIEEIEGDKIYELALSFDKAYKQEDLPIKVMPGVNWLWINSYNEEEREKMEKEVKENDWSANFIGEKEALGFSVVNDLTNPDIFNSEYNNFLDLLQTSFSDHHHQAYETIKDQESDEIEILGMVVYGNQEELASLVNKDYVKAASLGGIIDNY